MAVVSVSPDALRAERARVMEARAPREALERQRHRARQVLTGRWDASEEELRGEIAAQYEQLTAREVEELLVVATEVQRTERPKVDPASVHVRYQEDPEAEGKRQPAKRPDPAPAAKPDPKPASDYRAENGRKKRRPLEINRKPKASIPVHDGEKVRNYEGRNPSHRAIAQRCLRELDAGDATVTPAMLQEAVRSAGLEMPTQSARALLKPRKSNVARRVPATPVETPLTNPESEPAVVATPRPEPVPEPVAVRSSSPSSGLSIPPAPYPRAVTRGVAGGGIAVLPQLGTSRVRLWVDMEMPAYEARNVVELVMGIMEGVADA